MNFRLSQNWQLGESRKFTRSSPCGFVAQWLERATRIGKTLGSIPGGAALCFFVWSGCQFFYLCRCWKRREFEIPESFLFEFSPTSQPRLANDKGFATIFFLIGHKLTSNEARKIGLVTDFDPKGIISGVRVQAGLYLDMLDTDRSPNAVSVHAGTSQVDFEVDRPQPAPPGHLLITMVKEAVFCTKNEFWKMKKSRISHWSESDENAKWLRDCLWLCQACKRGFTCRPI